MKKIMKQGLTAALILITSVCFGQSTSAERDSVAQTAPFMTKVKMATHKAANALLADPSQATRVRQYAQLIISEPNGPWVLSLSYGCMTNVAVNSTSTDSDIEFTVNSLFAKFAYAYYREVQP